VLVANKIDVDYNVTRKEFKFASKHNLPFFFVSAADGTNVVKVFQSAILEAKRFKESGGRWTTLDVSLIFVVLTLSAVTVTYSHTGDFLSSLLDTLEGKHKVGESKSSSSDSKSSSDAK